MTGFSYDDIFRIGSLAFTLRTVDRRDAEALSLMFKQPLEAAEGGTAQATIDIVDADAAGYPEVPPDGLLISRSDRGFTLCSEVVTVAFERRGEAWRATIAVRAGGRTFPFYQVHLSIAMHRILLALERAYVHAAAVTVRDRTFLFMGEKGAGKSSIATSLGRLGGAILSDDHVLIGRTVNGYVVSGCERRARVTADTEAEVFGRALSIQAEDFAGTMKKEFLVSDFFESRPHDDAPLSGIFFPRVGARLHATARSPRLAALDLIRRTRPSYRPQDAEDVRALLEFWTGLASAVRACDLELSPSISDLAHLPDVLDAGLRG